MQPTQLLNAGLYYVSATPPTLTLNSLLGFPLSLQSKSLRTHSLSGEFPMRCLCWDVHIHLFHTQPLHHCNPCWEFLAIKAVSVCVAMLIPEHSCVHVKRLTKHLSWNYFFSQEGAFLHKKTEQTK